LHFATRVVLPELSPESPLLIKKFETDVANTAHQVGNLIEKVVFRSFILKGSNGHIDVESVQADEAIISTSNAGIQGIFNASTSLSLQTTNGRVDADIGLSSVNQSEPKLSLTTSNAPVTSRISLISDAGLGGSFQALATTSNARLDIDFPAAPPYSLLKFISMTSNAQAVVSLNAAYEGSFLLQTSSSKPRINQDRTVTDPSGKNRKRSLDVKQIRQGPVSGEVYWEDATEQDGPKVAGSVSVRTSNAHIDLNL